MTSKVWHTSQTLDGLIFGPLLTVCERHGVQNMVPQCLQCCLRFVTENPDLHAGHSSMSSSCCHLTWVSESRIFSNCICNTKWIIWYAHIWLKIYTNMHYFRKISKMYILKNIEIMINIVYWVILVTKLVRLKSNKKMRSNLCRYIYLFIVDLLLIT